MKILAPIHLDDWLTRHATERMKERKMDVETLEILRTHGDLRRSAHGGCARLRLSRKTAKRLDARRLYPRKKIEQARETLLVLSEQGRCVTAYKCPVDNRFRRSGARPSIQRQRRALEAT